MTADLRAFMGANEHNEGYVDGGLFGMSLLYSLETCGLAACPLNTMFSEEADEQTPTMLAGCHILRNRPALLKLC